MSKVFDETPKADTACKKRCEDLYSYLSRSANPRSGAGRRLIEDWLSRSPPDVQKDLCSRFQSGKDKDFNSAFQELFLRELLTSLECKVAAHPSVKGTSKRPDFQVQQPSESEFLLEARSLDPALNGYDNSPRGVLAYDFLDGLILSSSYSFGIEELVSGAKNLSQKLLAKHIREGLQRTSVTGGRVSIPLFETDDGWRIKVTAIPDYSNGPPTDGRVRYITLSRKRSDPSDSLHAALKRKGTRYGEQGTVPYVIAVNTLEPFLEESAFDHALFGERSTPMRDTTSKNRTSGFWGTAGSPKHQRVSAVLFTANLWYMALLNGEVRTRLYLNPWADRPYKGVLTQLCAVRLEEGVLNRYPGARVHELLHLQLQDC